MKETQATGFGKDFKRDPEQTQLRKISGWQGSILGEAHTLMAGGVCATLY
jgi:hypothetical protein